MGAWVAGAPLEGGGLGFPWVEIWEPQVSFGFQKKGFQGDLWLLLAACGSPGLCPLPSSVVHLVLAPPWEDRMMQGQGKGRLLLPPLAGASSEEGSQSSLSPLPLWHRLLHLRTGPRTSVWFTDRAQMHGCFCGLWMGGGRPVCCVCGRCVVVREGCSQSPCPGPEDSNPLETPSCFCSHLMPPHCTLHGTCRRVDVLKHSWKTPLSEALHSASSPGWENVDESSCQLVPHLHIWHGKCPFRSFCFRRKAGSPEDPVHLLPSPSSQASTSPPPPVAPHLVSHACTPSLKGEEPQLIFVESKTEHLAQCLQILKACLWSPFHFSCSLCQALPLLTCHVLSSVANENDDCSTLTSEIIVTMHTFQDVSWS